MGRLRFSASLLIFAGAAVSGAGVAASCSAEGTPIAPSGGGGGGGGGGGEPGAGEGGDGGQGTGGLLNVDGGLDPADDVTVNPCGTACGPKELCTATHLGLDDDCDGEIDEDARAEICNEVDDDCDGETDEDDVCVVIAPDGGVGGDGGIPRGDAGTSGGSSMVVGGCGCRAGGGGSGAGAWAALIAIAFVIARRRR